MDLTSWRLLIGTALRKMHGVVGEASTIDYVSIESSKSSPELVVRVLKEEETMFVNAVTNHVVDLALLGTKGQARAVCEPTNI